MEGQIIRAVTLNVYLTRVKTDYKSGTNHLNFENRELPEGRVYLEVYTEDVQFAEDLRAGHVNFILSTHGPKEVEQ